MSELHLDTKVKILRRTYKVDAMSARSVAFRERITRRVEVVTLARSRRLNSRRGRPGSDRRGCRCLNARVPLMQMFGYVNNLRSMSQGRATFQMEFDHYAPAPPSPEDDPPFRPAIGMRA